MENDGRVAALRGPLLYCAEAIDNPDVDLRDVVLNAPPEASWRDELLGGVTVLRSNAQATSPADDALYSAASTPAWGETKNIELTMIPYYAWANREAGQMQVWLRQS